MHSTAKGLQNFANCGRLVELYLRKNNITDLSEVQFLRGLGSLRVLWLSDNPCAKVPGYREYVLSVLPQLSKLDSMDVTFDVIDPGGSEIGWSWLPNLWKVRSRLSRSRLLQQKANFFCLRCTIFPHFRFLQASFQMGIQLMHRSRLEIAAFSHYICQISVNFCVISQTFF